MRNRLPILIALLTLLSASAEAQNVSVSARVTLQRATATAPEDGRR